jgi:PAS domain S-box-containing protein
VSTEPRDERRPPRPRRRSTPPPPLTRPTPERLLEVVLALGRDLHLGMDERALGVTFLRAIEELFPGRAVAIRIEPPPASESSPPERSVVLTHGASLTAGAESGPFALKRSSLGKTRLAQKVVASGRVRLSDTVEPVIDGVPPGFSIPLVAGGEIYGVLDVAYPEGGEDPAFVDADERTLIPIANQLSVALRNERLHGEAELLRDYLGKLVDHASALILGVDPRWRITVVNRAAASLVGVTPEELVGRDVRELVPEATRSRLVAVFARALAGHEATIDLELHGPHGAVRTYWHVAAIGSGARDSSRVEAIVAVGQDLTQIKSLERQVIQAEKLATLGQLAAGVVHELNNPLTSVIVYADYLLKKVERAQPLEHADADKLRRILEGAERILNFSRDLVQYAKPASEQVDVLSLNDVVRQSLSFCEHVLKKGAVRLVTELTPELPHVYGVRGQLQQVVINLITNAVQALVGGEGTVWVRTRAGDERIEVQIADDGVGIKRIDRERIFEPFFTTKTDGRGTGLGLSIVRNIVERHHGTITVESTPGEGTTFTITLPTTATPT